MLDVIKEYLVSIGFKTDDSSLSAAQNAMKKAGDSVDSFSNSAVKDFAKATTGVVSFVATATLALGKFVSGLAQSDLQTNMFARRMWMSTDAARAYQSSLKALGASINDLYLSPELMERFQELNNLAHQLAVPTADYEDAMRGVRDITFEFQKLKLEGMYALQWIGYYLTKYLASPMGDFKKGLSDLNTKIQQHMPEWTAKIAEVASWFVRLAEAAWSIRGAIGTIISIFTGFKILTMLATPLGLFVAGLTALLLLVDDFNTYVNGGESAFPKLWAWVIKFKDSLKNNETVKAFIKDIKTIAEDIKYFGQKLEEFLNSKEFQDKLNFLIKGLEKIWTWIESVGRSQTFKTFLSNNERYVTILWHGIETLWNWIVKLWNKLSENDTFGGLAQALGDLYGSVVDLVSAFGDMFNFMGDAGAGDLLSTALVSALGIVRDTLTSIAGLITIVAGELKGLFTGDYSGLEKGFKLFMDGIPKGIADAVKGSFSGEKKSNPKPEKKSSFEEDQESQSGIKQTIWNPSKNGISGSNGNDATANNSTIKYETNHNYNNTSNQTTNINQAQKDNAPSWNSFKENIPGSEMAPASVDWAALKKGFTAFINSIPQEFGDITKGLFQMAKGYGNNQFSVGGTPISYLYPQTTSSSISQVSMKQNYYIYGANDPQSVAKTVSGVTTTSLTRHFQGVNR
ncbi:hypothetical protein REC12_11510 [Desulfosporosinus sp. PR]|uniref:hypothetical protein n=1 Tax=Candidatus Desulfosporosinus nitrosoreducens TaxID=3401928 RepID=UPI0027F90B14|nr:hypothetical protein [Desulfosporosinus sp. PR]MDQ7094216.1 hypothetical protein [Desulfosporosinus sp. PR]